MSSCWVLTERRWPYEIKAASKSWQNLWQYSREETLNRPISMLQNGANEFSAAMLMRRFHQHDRKGTTCANVDKFGQLYSHIAYIVPHPAGLIGISTQIAPIARLKLHEKFAIAHDAQPRLDEDTLASVLTEVARHVGAGNRSHEQRFLLHRDAQGAPRPPPPLRRST